MIMPILLQEHVARKDGNGREVTNADGKLISSSGVLGSFSKIESEARSPLSSELLNYIRALARRHAVEDHLASKNGADK